MVSLTEIEEILWRPISAQIILGITACLLGYELLSGTVAYYQIAKELRQSPADGMARRGTGTQPSSVLKQLNIPIFGDYIPKALVDLNVKPSGLDLTLVGIVFSKDPKQSMAIISAPGNQVQHFFLGDWVPGQAKINQITPDGVVLEREGQLESLSLPKDELDFESPPSPLLNQKNAH